MALFIHADDFGLTKNISDDILHCYQNGVLNGLSVVPNGHAFEYAKRSYAELRRSDKPLRLAIHLNLFEGRALSPVDGAPLLTKGDGSFKLGFKELMDLYNASDKSARAKLRTAVKDEYERQIERVIEGFGIEHPAADSHVHYHMIPFVFDVLMELHEKYCFSYIRVPQEPFFFDALSIEKYISLNPVKHILLNSLAGKTKAKERISKSGAGYPDSFVGVLLSGRMRLAAGLSAVRKTLNEGKTAEILFHPGRAAEDELKFWQERPELVQVYGSRDRSYERRELCSPEAFNMIEEFM